MYGTIQNNTIKSPARLVKNACSSLPLCFKTCPKTVTKIPTAAILKIKFTLIFYTRKIINANPPMIQTV